LDGNPFIGTAYAVGVVEVGRPWELLVAEEPFHALDVADVILPTPDLKLDELERLHRFPRYQ
jgi:hypothetical protein